MWSFTNLITNDNNCYENPMLYIV